MTARIGFARTAAPLYRDMANALERALEQGIWKPGEQIPPEPELERRFGASRGTVRMAIAELVQKGWLLRQAGRGTFVLGPGFASLERYFRYEALPGGAPLTPYNLVLGQGLVPADAAVAEALGLAPEAPVARVTRLRHTGETPFLAIESYFPPAVWEIVRDADFTVHPLYDLFKGYGQYVVSAEEFLRADLATAAEAALLRIPTGSAVIRIERTARSFEQRPIEYRRATGRADRFRYHVRLS